MDWLGSLGISVPTLTSLLPALAMVLAALLVMYASAKANSITGYENRRTIVLREAARWQMAADPYKPMMSRRLHFICLSDEFDCQWWSEKLGVSRDALRAAVHEIGPMAADIERHLRLQRHAKQRVS